jgi:hypothetical protein
MERGDIPECQRTTADNLNVCVTGNRDQENGLLQHVSRHGLFPEKPGILYQTYLFKKDASVNLVFHKHCVEQARVHLTIGFANYFPSFLHSSPARKCEYCGIEKVTFETIFCRNVGHCHSAFESPLLQRASSQTLFNYSTLHLSSYHKAT